MADDKVYGGSILQTTPVWKNEKNEVVPKPKNYKDKTSLDMADFYTLMAAQMKYQDVLNPESNTAEMMTQMVQMSMVNAIQDMMTMSTTTYAASMIGKNVVIAEAVGGKINRIEGVVEGVNLYDGDPKLIINGKEYSMNQIMQLGTVSKPEEPTEPDDEKDPDDGKVDDKDDVNNDGSTGGDGSNVDDKDGVNNDGSTGGDGSNVGDKDGVDNDGSTGNDTDNGGSTGGDDDTNTGGEQA